MLYIDGAQGEGGGQVLRTSLAMALVTGQPFLIEDIRAGRRKPGLMRQHLTAVRAAVAISGAAVTGDAIGSCRLEFRPGRVRAGEYEFAVGTAGSATLVLQTVLPALLVAPGPSRLVLRGGTHNPFAPPYDFLARAFLPLVNRIGPKVTSGLEGYGFYPAGGGCFTVEITPASRLEPLELMAGGALGSRRIRALVSGLPVKIATTEAAVLCEQLNWSSEVVETAAVESPGPGNVVMVEIAAEQVTEVFTGFGQRGVTAHRVARELVRQVRAYQVAEVPVGPHLADQLLIPLAMAGGGRFRTVAPTRHTLTNCQVIGSFLPVAIEVTKDGETSWIVTVEPCSDGVNPG